MVDFSVVLAPVGEEGYDGVEEEQEDEEENEDLLHTHSQHGGGNYYGRISVLNFFIRR